jgi:hypothetical protein
MNNLEIKIGDYIICYNKTQGIVEKLNFPYMSLNYEGTTIVTHLMNVKFINDINSEKYDGVTFE